MGKTGSRWLCALLIIFLIATAAGIPATLADMDTAPKAPRPHTGSSGSESAPPVSSSAQREETKTEVLLRVRAHPADEVYELPVAGATGYPTTATNLYGTIPDGSATVVKKLSAGEPLLVLAEYDDVWEVETEDGTTGFLESKNCFVNLADLVPSIVYRMSNADASLFRTAGKEIPDITGEKLFTLKGYNPRFEREMFCAPIYYPMAKKIAAAQKAALEKGDTLVIYETYRPYSVQQSVGKAVQALCKADKEVNAAITKGSWNVGWFISLDTSNHQKGCAMDVSLAKIDGARTMTYGDGLYAEITAYTEYEMQSPMHELSERSVSMVTPVSDSSATAWKSVKTDPRMTEGSLMLRDYCTNAGMTPLASEWWHFNDLDALKTLNNRFVRSGYDFSKVRSERVTDDASSHG